MNRTATTLTALLAVPVLALTACSGGTSSTQAAAPSAFATNSPGAGAAQGGAAGFEAYRSCMADHGVDFPDFRNGNGGPPSGRPAGAPPSGGAGDGQRQPLPVPSGVDQQAFDAAEQACQDLRPTLGQGGPGGPGIDASALAAFRSCLADHGVTLTADQNPFRDLDRSKPDVRSAFDTCAPLLPQRGSAAPQQ